MANIQSFTELHVWQKAHEIALLVYKVTKDFPPDERFGLVSQIRRAVVSIAANIAEGFHRYTVHDSLNFYTIAKGSLEEVRYYSMLARDLGYIGSEAYTELEKMASEVSKMLIAWMQSQRINTR